jgi:ribosomal protein S18 acetylase RimI-like enzyme
MTQERKVKEIEPREKVSQVKITKLKRVSGNDPEPRTEYILSIGKEQIGHAVIGSYIEKPDVVLQQISIQTLYRHRGYGELLLSKVIADCDKAHQSIWLSASPSLANAAPVPLADLVRFYEKFGFVRVGKPAGLSVKMVRYWNEVRSK